MTSGELFGCPYDGRSNRSQLVNPDSGNEGFVEVSLLFRFGALPMPNRVSLFVMDMFGGFTCRLFRFGNICLIFT
jgi:hypothetical protein